MMFFFRRYCVRDNLRSVHLDTLYSPHPPSNSPIYELLTHKHDSILLEFHLERMSIWIFENWVRMRERNRREKFYPVFFFNVQFYRLIASSCSTCLSACVCTTVYCHRPERWDRQQRGHLSIKWWFSCVREVNARCIVVYTKRRFETLEGGGQVMNLRLLCSHF